MRTFKLDEVEEAREAPPTRDLGAVVGEVLCLGANAATPVIEMQGAHPLLGAIHVAFSEHRPLVLSPDAVWLTIAQGVAQHVRMHADTLRGRLVRHHGRDIIEVGHAGAMPRDDAAAWGVIVESFRTSIGERMGEGIARLFTCDFTTTTAVERVASEIVLMDAVSPYFDFYAACICGIPEVTLLGTPEDWRRIRERVDVVAELGLEAWAKSLAPIADQLVSASEGHVDLSHWKRIYKPRESYGSELITGWSARLYPYVKREGRVTEVNPLVSLPFDEPRGSGDANGMYYGPGIKLEDAPGGLSSVRARIVDHTTSTRTEVAFEGGLLGVAFDGRAVRPLAGYAIREHTQGMLDLVEEIQRAHVTEPPAPGEDAHGMADVRLFYDRIGAATLFTGARAWNIRARPDWEHVELMLPNGRSESLVRFIDLPCERCIAMATDWERGGVLYVLCDTKRIAPAVQTNEPVVDEVTGLPCDANVAVRRSRSTQPFAEIPVVGTSFTMLLAYALQREGGDDVPTLGLLVDRLPPSMKA